jgi:hypothetical protein
VQDGVVESDLELPRVPRGWELLQEWGQCG